MPARAPETSIRCELGLHHWAEPIRDPNGTWVTCCDECLEFEFVVDWLDQSV